MSQRTTAEDAIALEHETLDRLANVVVTTVPLVLLGVAVWLAWGGALHWQDLVVLGVSYALTGAGIPEADLSRIQEPLYSTKARGLGLGLAIVRAILDKCGGGLRVESEPGRGSVFTVKLMASPAQEERE